MYASYRMFQKNGQGIHRVDLEMNETSKHIDPRFYCSIFHDVCDIKSEKNCAYCLRKLRRIPTEEITEEV